MITLFNRAEVTFTYSSEEFFRMQQALSGAGIPCRTKVKNRVNPVDRACTGSLPYGQGQDVEYRIFVHKEDLDEAMRALKSAENDPDPNNM